MAPKTTACISDGLQTMMSSRPHACSEVAIDYKRGTEALQGKQRPRILAKSRSQEPQKQTLCSKCRCDAGLEEPHPPPSVQDYAPGQKPCPLGLMRAITPADLTAAKRRNSSRAVSWIAKYAGTRAVRLSRSFLSRSCE